MVNPKGILTNKYFLYFLFFVSIIGIGFFIHIHKYDYITLFLLVGLLARCYHGNMVIVLLTALTITVIYILLQQNKYREGIENQQTTTTSATSSEKDKQQTTEIKAAGDLKKTGTGAFIQADATSKAATGTAKVPESDIQNLTSNLQDLSGDIKNLTSGDVKNLTQTTLPATNVKPSDSTETFSQNTQKGPKINYAATVQDAYENLDKLVGGDGLNHLTNQTTTLLNQQTKLVDTMKNLTPLMNQVRGLISTFEKASPASLANPANLINA